MTAEGKSSTPQALETENCAALSPDFFGLTLEVCTSQEAFPGIWDSLGCAECWSAQQFMHLDYLGWEGASVVYNPTNKHSFSLGLCSMLKCKYYKEI